MFSFVTPNGSVDLTFRQLLSPVDHQAEAELLAESAGGKGHNAARMVVALGDDARALGLAGDWVGSRMAELLARDGIEARLTPIARCSRLFVTIADLKGRRRVSYHLAGPHVTPPELRALLDEIRRSAQDSEAVMIGGAPPPGMDVAWLTDAVRAIPRERCIVDTSGLALLGALAGRPGTVKLNQAEFASLGYPEARTSLRGLVLAIARASERFEVRDWWITLGRQGALLSTGDRLLRAKGVVVAVHNTSGAGDGFLAGMLHGRAAGEDAAGQARWAVAASAAVCEQVAPLRPSLERVSQLRDEVVVGEISSRGRLLGDN